MVAKLVIHCCVTKYPKLRGLKQPAPFILFFMVLRLTGLSEVVLTQGLSCSCSQTVAGARIFSNGFLTGQAENTESN